MADTWTAISGYTPQDYSDTLVFEMSSATKQVEKILGQALVAGEENSQYIKFVLPRYWDGIDISSKTFTIEYALAGTYYGTSEAVNAEMSAEQVRFGWVVPETACAISGTLFFVLKVESTDYILKSQIVEVSVYKTINVEDVVPEPTKEAWYRDFEARVETAIGDAEATLTAAQEALTAAQEAQASAENAAQNAQTAEDNAETAAAMAQTRYGSPLTAAEADEMVEQNRVYVYVGSEAGYTYGHWYYYNGMAWTDGGVYNGSGINTDTTLTQAGMAADAKVVGDELSTIKEDFTATLKDCGTLTSNDDLNTVTTSGVYWYSATNKPANAVSRNIHARVLVIKSTTAANYGAEWQITILEGQMYYRSHNPSGTPDTWSDWMEVADNADIQSVLAQIDSYDGTTVRYRATLTAADDLNAIEKTGSYYYNSDNKPANSPANLLSRPVVIKSATASNHNGEAQFVIQDGVFYFRSKERPADDWNDWKSYGLGAPIYQQETLPYNAVTYHAKWDALIQNRVLRRVDLGYVDNDSAYPMYAYEFCPQRDMVVASGAASTPRAFDWNNALYQRPKILIIGGVHGNEKCTPMDIYAIAKMLLKRDNNDVACKFDWFFIPLVNPWGYSHARLDSGGNIIYDNSGTASEIVECTASINAGIRNNAHDQNINRDWSDVVYTLDGVQYGFQTPELQLIKNYVLGIAPDFFLDAHQNHANTSTSNTNPVCCHAGAPINSADASTDYAELMRKIYRYIDIANADTDKTMLRYADHPIHKYQACRIWDTLPAATSEHYFAGVTALNGSTVIGNTQHGSIATPYSICTETSEICATYAKTTDWYNPVACTFSCTYLWNIIKQIASLF